MEIIEEYKCPRCSGAVGYMEYNNCGGRQECDYERLTCVDCGELTYCEEESVAKD